MNSPTHPSLHCQAHWQNAQSQRYDQILPKSLPARPTPTHIRQDSAANLTNKKTPVHNKRYKTLGVKWLFNVSAPHQILVSGDTDAAPKSPTFHTADRYV